MPADRASPQNMASPTHQRLDGLQAELKLADDASICWPNKIITRYQIQEKNIPNQKTVSET
jgi:hypothetical protein